MPVLSSRIVAVEDAGRIDLTPQADLSTIETNELDRLLLKVLAKSEAAIRRLRPDEPQHLLAKRNAAVARGYLQSLRGRPPGQVNHRLRDDALRDDFADLTHRVNAVAASQHPPSVTAQQFADLLDDIGRFVSLVR
jgi:hypothetical protein